MPNLTIKNVVPVCSTPTLKAPGLIDQIWWVPVCDLTTEGVINPSETDIDKYGLVATAHIFAGAKGFAWIQDIQENTGKYDFSDQGGKGFGNFNVKAEFMGRTLNPKIIGLINQAKFQPSIALVKLKSGETMQLGTSEFPAYMSADFDTNTNQGTDVWGVKIKIEATQPLILRYNYPTLAITLLT